MSVFEKAPCSGEVRLQDNGHHSAEAAHLSLGQFVLGMALESRITDRLDFWLISKKSCDFNSVLAMSFHSQGQSLQAAERQKTIKRSGDRADGVLQKRNLIAELL